MAASRGNGKRGTGNSSPGDRSGREEIENCPPERDIENLALGKMSGARRNRIARHIEVCFSCNETFQAFSYFYQRANRERVPEGAYPGMASPLPRPLSDYIVHLKPVHLPDAGSDDDGDDRETLFTSLCTCVSSPGKFRGTLLLDRNSGEIIVRLEAGGNRSVEHLVVLVDAVGEKVLTDGRGIAALGAREPSLLMDARLSVYLPLFEIRTTVGVDLNQEELFNPEPVPGFPVETAWVYVDDDRSLCLEISFSTDDDDDDHRRFTAACIGRGRAMIVPVLGGVGVFRNMSLGSPLLISVYPN